MIPRISRTTLLRTISKYSGKYSFAVVPIIYSSMMLAGVSSKSVERTDCTGSGVICRRLRNVPGDGEKVNDVVFCGEVASAESNVVFFGGDVQDYEENMLSHRDNHRHREWNLETTARIIHKRFPASHVWVVKPSRMHLKTFSVYQNFVESNDFGAPTHNNDHGGFRHLHKLLQNAVIAAAKTPVDDSQMGCGNGDVDLSKNSDKDQNTGSQNICQHENTESKDVCSAGRTEGRTDSDTAYDKPIECSIAKPLILSAFSKGCIVLNQILYELENAREDADMNSLVERIQSMYWLDGGHSGGSNTWVVHQFVLKNLIGLNLDVFVHVTPYQIHDEMRAWIGKEERKFVDRLKKMGVRVTEVVHFEDEERSLANHFKVLTSF